PNCLTAPGAPGAVPSITGDGSTTTGDTGTTGMGGPSFGGLAGGAGLGGGGGVDPNYIDAAIPANRFLLRFDAIYDYNRPDRAEFFYPKCGCFGTPDA